MIAEVVVVVVVGNVGVVDGVEVEDVKLSLVFSYLRDFCPSPDLKYLAPASSDAFPGLAFCNE